MDVGFLGVGRMGQAIAANLVKAGHRVRAFDKSAASMKAAQQAGIDVVSSAQETTGGDVLISMLPNDDALRDVFIRGDLLSHGKPGTISINMGTVSLDCVDELVAVHEARGRPYVAATVFGRPDVAAAAKLAVLAAGDPATIDRVQPLLDAIGRKTFHVGDKPRQANVAKIAGNLMVACAIEAIAEAAVLLRKYEMSAADVLDVIVESLFAVPVYQGYARAIGREEYVPPGFDLVLGMKDVRLALQAGEAVDAPLPFASVLRDAFIDAIANGDAHKDWSAIGRVAARKAGLNDH
ncbi:MAG: NAD(P)-dependent oxidoreductase [Pseudolabrys sp.]|nr:NAD(P)-dependent oxidoreductase [Pseudolabrys sp.]